MLSLRAAVDGHPMSMSFQARSCTIESLEMSHTCTPTPCPPPRLTQSTPCLIHSCNFCHGHRRRTRKLCTSAAQDSAQPTWFHRAVRRCHSLVRTTRPPNPRLTLSQHRAQHMLLHVWSLVRCSH